MSENRNNLILNIPKLPGIYKFFSSQNEIIYVGKAKNLKKRVSSYFQKNHETTRIKLLIKKINKIETIIVDNEFDALILENTLIKKHRPRYNIRLKDDKTYPWICISKDPFSRIYTTHQPDFENNYCFGPYPSYRRMNAVLEIIQTTFPLRTCKLKLNEKNISEKKFKICLQYQIGKCLGPCEGLIKSTDYQKMITSAKEIIKGNLSLIIKDLKKEMLLNSKALNFEIAQNIKEKINLLETYKSKSTLVHPSIKECDVVTIVSDHQKVYVCNFMRIIEGAVVSSNNLEIESKLSEGINQIFEHSLIEAQKILNGFSKELLVNIQPLTFFPSIRYTIPKKGHKKDLILLSEKNAKIHLIELLKRKQLSNNKIKERHNLLIRIKKDLILETLPNHIEAFDNSNIQGFFAVSACVVFKNGRPAPSFYRHYNIKTVKGPNDYASMEEVVYRRYKKLLEEKSPLPQLIIIDGGKGQLESAAKSLAKLNLLNSIKLISIAKRLEIIYSYGDSTPLYLDKKSSSLKLFQQIRDEAHRFSITHHRKKRTKETIKTKLTDVKGIGAETSIKLLKKYGSIENIKNASFVEIKSLIGQAKAKLIKEKL